MEEVVRVVLVHEDVDWSFCRPQDGKTKTQHDSNKAERETGSRRETESTAERKKEKTLGERQS